MTKQVATQKQNAVAEPSGRNWAEEYGDEAFQSNITGDLLKFVKGEWLAGQDETPVPLGTELVAACHILQSGWMRWEDNKPVETVIGYRAEGFRPPARETLGYTDKEHWGELNGQVIDPWRRVDILLMADPSTGQVYTFSPMSDGGLQAIKSLMREWGPHIRTKPNDIPVVSLSSTSYKHPTFGKVYKPVLELVEYRDVNDVSFTVADDDDEEAVPAQTSARSTKPAPRKPVAKAPAPPPKKATNGRQAGRRY